VKEKLYLSGAEQTIISGLNHSLYTADFIQEWINRDDNVFANAPAALQSAAANGYYEAVKAMNAAGGRISYKKEEAELLEKFYRIFSEISRECKKQDAKWGEQNHPMTADYKTADYTGCADVYRWKAAQKKNLIKEGHTTWDSILLEEVYEAFSETDPEKQREEMVQAAAVVVQIIERLERRMKAGK
jgi:hypothetical protein